MPLVQEIKYEETTGNWKNRSPEEISKAVLFMLYDVRGKIGKLEHSFLGVGLTRVLVAIEAGKYEVNGGISTRIDLSSAKGVINTYREYSEGGCRSCSKLGRETINSQDATSGLYCEVSDPNYNKNARGGKPGVKYSGFSPKVNEHYKTPCTNWKPRFSPPLEILIKQNNSR